MTEPIDWRLAGFGQSTAFKPVTIGDLRRKGHVLEVHCNSRFKELVSTRVPFDDEQPVPTAGRRFKCSRCGGKAITTRPQVYEESTAAHRARIEAEQRVEQGAKGRRRFR